MEKKRNQLARAGQLNSDHKKSQDASTKHYRRRKETFQSEYSNNSSSSSKQPSNKYRNNNNNNNFYYEKRPRKNAAEQQNEIDSNIALASTTGLTKDYELNSVYNHGSKKNNLNHLLNFRRYTKDSDEIHYRGVFSKFGYCHRFTSKKYRYNKEQYLQANCQFIVREDVKYDYSKFKKSPDSLVEWDQIEKVLINSCEESQCPICLNEPKAAKITRCGHIYCFSCMLHYLSLSDKSWRKCPICFDAVNLGDLKSTSSKHIHQSFKVGDIISLELMKREKGSLFVNKAYETDNVINEFPSYSDVHETTYAKLIMANKKEILKIIEQEKYELDFQLAEDGFDCPESIFVHQAIDLLNIKQLEIEKLIEEELRNEQQLQQDYINKNQIESNNSAATVNEVNTTTDDESSNASIIDEDCNLTINDIDISTCLQSKYFYYYQAPNAQNIFLHSINSKMLQLMYGNLENSPQNVRGKIIQIECCSMNEDLRKRLKYLQHLPATTTFQIVEIEFEAETISSDVLDVFSDELMQRYKMRQRREREEKKRERVINEINDRQMGKMLRATANIDICSNTQFPECGNFNDFMPPLSANANAIENSPSKTNGLPSFANMLTSPTTSRDAEKLWPSLLTKPSSSSSTANQNEDLFFRDEKYVSIKKKMTAQAEVISKDENSDDNDYDYGEVEHQTPIYKNNLSDALVNALSKASLDDANSTKSSGKKKKGKKTLLFSSGMNFN